MDTLDERTKAAAEELIQQKNGVTEAAIERMIDAFHVMDKDGSNYLEHNEVRQCLQIIGSNPTDERVSELISQIDSSKDGKIDLAEFFLLAKTVKVGQAEKEDLSRAFKVFDRDGNGKICKSELEAVLKKMNVYSDDEEIDMMMKGADKNDDGYLDINELVDFLNSQN